MTFARRRTVRRGDPSPVRRRRRSRARFPKGAIIAGLVGAVGVGAGLVLLLQGNTNSTPTQPAVLTVPEYNTGAPAALPAGPSRAGSCSGTGTGTSSRRRSQRRLRSSRPDDHRLRAALRGPEEQRSRCRGTGSCAGTGACARSPATGAPADPHRTGDRAPAAAEPVPAAQRSRTGRRFGAWLAGSGTCARSGAWRLRSRSWHPAPALRLRLRHLRRVVVAIWETFLLAAAQLPKLPSPTDTKSEVETR